MQSDIAYYFSKWTFLLLTLFLISFSTGLIYFSLQFYPEASQYSLLFASPLLLVLYILPEYIRTFYFLITHRAALTLTQEKLVDNFKGKEYKWSEIKRVGLSLNEGRAPGGYIALYLASSEEVIRIPYAKLKRNKFDILDDLISFHNSYQKRTEVLL